MDILNKKYTVDVLVTGKWKHFLECSNKHLNKKI